MLFKVVTSTHAVKYINLANVTSVTVTPKVDSGIRRITFWFGAASVQEDLSDDKAQPLLDLLDSQLAPATS